MQNRRIFLPIWLGIVAGLGFLVVKPFLTPMVLAGILAFVSWPVYRRLLQLLKGRRAAGAPIMTTLLVAILVMPALWLPARLQGELSVAYQASLARASQGPLVLPEAFARIPVVGPSANDLPTAYGNDPSLWKQQLKDWQGLWIGEFVGIGLLAWGAFVVNPTDNILRPLSIGKGTDIPLLVVFFGVAGGLLAFGFVGLFVGLSILTVLLAIWREWLGADAVEAARASTLSAL
jgi:predicted PurR-regulated permease PerM